MTKREYRYHSLEKYRKFISSLYKWTSSDHVKNSPLTQIYVSPTTIIYATKEDGEDKWKWEIPLSLDYPKIVEIR
jgi:hypothetical protein